MNSIDVHRDPVETKQRIIQSARKLFSQHGFFGASIREIAKDSGVNIAAINYHFKNKENLFWSIISDSFQNAERVCEGLANESANLADFALKVFDHFMNNSELMRNTMKMLLIQKISPPAESFCCRPLSEGGMGPPGGHFFAEFLKREIPYELSTGAIFWGVKNIFGIIVHWATMSAAAHFESMAQVEPLMRPEQMRRDVILSVRATVEFLRKNQREFTNQ